MPKILLIEDDISFCKLLEKFLIKKSYHVSTAFSAAEARLAVKKESFNLILMDIRLPDCDGIGLMTEFKISNPEIPVVLMTGYSDVNTAVKAIKNGAADYISKPFNPDEVLLVITNAMQLPQEEIPVKEKKIHKKPADLDNEFVKGISAASKKLLDHIELVSPTDMSVLIIG
jgi:two-component system, NtrC family, response regulator HydG